LVLRLGDRISNVAVEIRSDKGLSGRLLEGAGAFMPLKTYLTGNGFSRGPFNVKRCNARA
jgi:hypothetical protein